MIGKLLLPTACHHGPARFLFLLAAVIATGGSAGIVLPNSNAPADVLEGESDGGNPEPAVPHYGMGPGVGDVFLENVGQVSDPRVIFTANGGGIRYSFGSTFVLALVDPPMGDLNRGKADGLLPEAPPRESLGSDHPDVLSFTFVTANDVKPEGRQPAATTISFIRGNNPDAWITGVPTFGILAYEEIYDGIDLVLRVSDAGLKYDFELDAGRDPQAILIRIAGAREVAVDSDGQLIISTPKRTVVDAAPVAFQGDREVPCAYVLEARDQYGFSCDRLDPGLPLTIDPLIFATYIGGSGRDFATEVAFGPGESTFVAGYTDSLDFPVTAGAVNTTLAGGLDVFVARLAPDGSAVEYATFIGGSGLELPYSLHVNPGGEVFVTGVTNSSDFPTTPGAWRTTLAPNAFGDSFVFRLAADGSILKYATLLGGAHNQPGGSFLSADGSILVAGTSTVHDFPNPPGGPWTDLNPNSTTREDGFLVRLSADGDELIHGTYLGGGQQESVAGISVDEVGDIWLTGITGSTDFPVTSGAFQPTMEGPFDAYIARVNSTGLTLQYASYLGGSGPDGGNGLAITPTGDPVLWGHTQSQDLPTTPGSFQPEPGKNGTRGTNDCFVARIDKTTGLPRFVTYLGGLLDDYPYGGIAVDSDSNIYLAGFTQDLNFPTTPNALRPSTGTAVNDSFLVKMNAAGTALAYSTLLGGDDLDFVIGIDQKDHGLVLVAMYTYGSDLPTTPGALGTTARAAEGYVALLEIPEPTLFIYSPANGSNVSVPNVWVAGLTDPGVNLTVNGISVFVADNGFFGLAVALLPGPNAIAARAVAPDGRTTSASVVVRYTDPVPALVAQLAALSAGLNSTNAALNATRAELVNKTADLNATRAELAALGDDLNATAARLDATQGELAATEAALQTAMDQVTRLQAQAIELGETGNSSLRLLGETQANLSAALVLIGELEDSLQTVRASANGTAVAYQQLVQRADAAEAALGAMAAAAAANELALNQTRDELDDAREEIAATRGLVSALLVAVLALAAGLVLVLWRGRSAKK